MSMVNLVIPASAFSGALCNTNRGASERHFAPATLYDDFSGDLSKWVAIAPVGTWRISGGGLLHNLDYLDVGTHIIRTATAQGQYIAVHAIAKGMGNYGISGLILNYSDSSNYYYAWMRSSGGLGAGIYIYKKVGGVNTLIASAPYTLGYDTWRAISFQNNNGLLSLNIAGCSVLEVTNNELSGTYAGLSAYHETEFDNISVSSVNPASPETESSVIDLGSSQTWKLGSSIVNANLGINAQSILIQYAIGDATPPAYNGSWLTVAQLQAVGDITGRYGKFKIKSSAAPFIFTIQDLIIPVSQATPFNLPLETVDISTEYEAVEI